MLEKMSADEQLNQILFIQFHIKKILNAIFVWICFCKTHMLLHFSDYEIQFKYVRPNNVLQSPQSVV